MGKKKRPASHAEQLLPECDSVSNTSTDKVSCATVVDQDQQVPENIPVFKDPKFVNAGKSALSVGKKNRVWKTLKQLTVAERSIPNAVTYSNLDSPPSIKPPKKYSDISGLPANYTDPLTKLRFSSASEFQTIRTLSPEVVNSYLSLRRAALP